LLKGNFRQRIVQLFGTKYDERLVPVDEETDVVGISGFVGKPEFARKNRGEQFFFVNGRFIKHPYLHHALMAAFDGLLSDGKHPPYFINLKVDPSRIDVNIHPTKTEVKFREEQAIYPILRSAVKRGLGKFQIAPTLDFERESSFDIAPFDHNRPVVIPGVQVNPDYNPFEEERKPQGNLASRIAPRNPGDGWREFYKIVEDDSQKAQQVIETMESSSDEALHTKPTLFQMGKSYIVSSIRSGMMLIDQQRAHERVLYEYFLLAGQHSAASQRLLFPETIELGAQAHASMVSSREVFHALGLEIEDLGGRTVVVHAVPADSAAENVNELVEMVLSSLMDETDATESLQQRIAKGLARASAIKRGRSLSEDEMRDLIDRLFTCEVPAYSPSGKPAIVTFTPDEIAAKFR
jgi:DNA mismatch repair protein MutL